MLSQAEEAEMSRARGHVSHISEDVILEGLTDEPEPIHLDFGNGNDSRRQSVHSDDEGSHGEGRRRMSDDHHSEHSPRMDEDNRSIGASTAAGLGGLGGGMQGMTGMNGGFVGRNFFNYSEMESWANQEKVALGQTQTLAARAQGPMGDRRGDESGDRAGGRSFFERSSLLGGEVEEAKEDDGAHPTPANRFHRDSNSTEASHLPVEENHFVRRRHRKLSQSNSSPHARRQGKLALFEGSNPGSTTAGNSPLGQTSVLGPSSTGKPSNASAPLLHPINSRDSQQRQGNYSTFPSDSPHAPNSAPLPPPLQDRPYRFSFYSNALPATIHARSLSELPADGQSFEDLFTGKNVNADTESVRNFSGGGGGDSAGGSGSATPINLESGGGALPMKKEGLLSKAIGNGRAALANQAAAAGGAGEQASMMRHDDPESSTWWLDVLCPTDEEMKMLSKVRL
jgi:magnesium transporter